MLPRCVLTGSRGLYARELEEKPPPGSPAPSQRQKRRPVTTASRRERWRSSARGRQGRRTGARGQHGAARAACRARGAGRSRRPHRRYSPAPPIRSSHAPCHGSTLGRAPRPVAASNASTSETNELASGTGPGSIGEGSMANTSETGGTIGPVVGVVREGRPRRAGLLGGGEPAAGVVRVAAQAQALEVPVGVVARGRAVHLGGGVGAGAPRRGVDEARAVAGADAGRP